MAQLMRSQTMTLPVSHPHSRPDPTLEQWRTQQERLAEQCEMEDLMRKVEAKKLETRKWVLDQQRWEHIDRPPHERRATALVLPTAGRSATSTPTPSQPRSRTPTQQRSRTPGAERPSVSRRGSETVQPRPPTPTPIPPLRPRAAQRSATMPTSIPVPIPHARTAERFSPEVEEMRLAAEAWMQDWCRVDEQLRVRAEAEAARTRAVQDSVRRMQAKLGPSTPQQTDDEHPSKPAPYHADVRREQQMARVFATYCERWAALQAVPPEKLTFKTIPWPVATPPASASDITLAAVSAFLLSPSHSLGKTTRQRAREAMLRWHPDR